MKKQIRKMLIPNPLDIDALIRKIPKGKLATVSQIRECPAKDFHVDTTCPLTTGIFLRIAAEAAEEDLKDYYNMSRDKFITGVKENLVLKQVEDYPHQFVQNSSNCLSANPVLLEFFSRNKP